MQTRRSLIDIVSEDIDQSGRAKVILAEIARAESVDFILALGATAISDTEGASAAGATPQARRLTPKLDAEALITGRTALGESLPSSPAGVTSPVVITRACLSLIEHIVRIVDCGTFVPPQVTHITAGCRPGRDFTQTDSMDIAEVRALFDQGREMALSCSNNDSVPVLAECVPGGTTTALGVLKALGFEADRMLSSSIPGKKAGLQAQLVAAGLDRLEQSLGVGALNRVCQRDPLYAVSFLGDPMQAFAAGFTLGALEDSTGQNNRPKAVVLAGGSQMLAVYALVRALLNTEGPSYFRGRDALSRQAEASLMVVTTKWVAYDPFAKTKALAQLIGAPYVAAFPDFSSSRHAGLKAYEDGHVKEGVGAGASIILASLLGREARDPMHIGLVGELKERTIINTIDDFYDSIVLA